MSLVDHERGGPAAIFRGVFVAESLDGQAQAGRRPRRRGTRLPLAVEIEYRFAAADEWRTARTINLSRSGVLFESPSEPPVGDGVEFVLRLARARHSEDVRDLRCQGRLVRTENRVGAWGVAATIDSYQATTD